MILENTTYKSNLTLPLSFLRVGFVLIAAFLFPPFARTQQLPVLTQYMFSQMTFNPGYAGSTGGICVNGLIREQWMGFKDNEGNKIAPESIFLTVDAPVKFLHGALGGSILSERIGFFNNIGVKIGYAFRMDLGAGEFSAGIQANLMNYRIDFSKFEGHVIDPNDPVFEESGEKTDLTIDADLGVYYEVPDKYYIGLSSGQLFQSKAKNSYYQQRRTYYLTGGYNWMLPNHPSFEIKPSAIFVYDGAAFTFNIAALVAYNKKFWGGLEYRFQDAIAVLVGANIKSFHVGISYDINTSALSRYNSGSIEVMLGYCFKIEVEKYRKRYKNTRFL
ncbi:MAG: type IX secretion system membrane protein PorP/SprF [Bacteroidales bacterium]|nr:type IX secretion system membrane protein PorP/SprF [Bacteroidales bacterium]